MGITRKIYNSLFCPMTSIIGETTPLIYHNDLYRFIKRYFNESAKPTNLICELKPNQNENSSKICLFSYTVLKGQVIHSSVKIKWF